MRTVICFFCILVCNLACSSQSLLNLRETDFSTWVTFNKGNATDRNGQVITQRHGPSTQVRSVYVQREMDQNPILFYTHQRRIEALLGHQGKLVLINDYFATKACKIIVVEIDSRTNRRIDSQARRLYLNTTPKQWFPNHAIPKAIAFSPDDKMVLIAMKSTHMADSSEHADQFDKTFERWSYVVDSLDGTVIRVFQTNGTIPRYWWKS